MARDVTREKHSPTYLDESDIDPEFLYTADLDVYEDRTERYRRA